jgi:predicted enzyme related to lactoylglutathione lyase
LRRHLRRRIDWDRTHRFCSEDVWDAREQVLTAGGRSVGEIVTVTTCGVTIKWCYVTDPEGNIIELQATSR